MQFLLSYLEKNTVFQSQILYSKIELECIHIPNTQTTDWLWNDEGTLKSTLPLCVVRPLLVKTSSN